MSKQRAKQRAINKVAKLENKWTKRQSKLSKVLKMTGALNFKKGGRRHRRTGAGKANWMASAAAEQNRKGGSGGALESKAPGGGGGGGGASAAASNPVTASSPRKVSKVVPFQEP